MNLYKASDIIDFQALILFSNAFSKNNKIGLGEVS